MTRAEIDVMWSRALSAAVLDGEAMTRYHFASALLEAAAQACGSADDADAVRAIAPNPGVAPGEPRPGAW
jgi:hypothetical protein